MNLFASLGKWNGSRLHRAAAPCYSSQLSSNLHWSATELHKWAQKSQASSTNPPSWNMTKENFPKTKPLVVLQFRIYQVEKLQWKELKLDLKILKSFCGNRWHFQPLHSELCNNSALCERGRARLTMGVELHSYSSPKRHIGSVTCVQHVQIIASMPSGTNWAADWHKQKEEAEASGRTRSRSTPQQEQYIGIHDRPSFFPHSPPKIGSMKE